MHVPMQVPLILQGSNEAAFFHWTWWHVWACDLILPGSPSVSVNVGTINDHNWCEWSEPSHSQVKRHTPTIIAPFGFTLCGEDALCSDNR